MTTMLNGGTSSVCYALGKTPSGQTTLYCGYFEDKEEESVTDNREFKDLPSWKIFREDLPASTDALSEEQLVEPFKRLTTSALSGRVRIAHHQARVVLQYWSNTGLSIYAAPWLSAHKEHIADSKKGTSHDAQLGV